MPLPVVYNGTYYYYVTDLQGDVVAIVDTNKEIVVEYLYDAWGRLLETSGTKAADLGLHNPLRYRGYVYDPESGLYYLQSRYYNPTLGRFINADSIVGNGDDLLGQNMFAYCNNNPVNAMDSNGKDPVLFAAAGAAVAGALISLFYYIQTNGDAASIGGALLAMAGGALSGALGGAAGMLTGQMQSVCIIGAGIVAGLIADCSGGNFWVGAILGFLSSIAGTHIELSMFEGMTLSFASFIATLGTGYPAEMAAQAIQQDLYEHQLNANEPPPLSTGIGSQSGPGHGHGGSNKLMQRSNRFIDRCV